MAHKPLNICKCSHRNIKLLGDGLIAFTFDGLVYNILSDLPTQLSPLLSLVHVQFGAHEDTKQSDYISLSRRWSDTCDANYRKQLV